MQSICKGARTSFKHMRKSTNVTQDPQTRVCSICNLQGLCSRSTHKCITLAKFGCVVQKKDYFVVLNMDIPVVSDITFQDVCVAGIPQTAEYHHLIIEHFYKDRNGMKYCSLSSLSHELVPERQHKLFTLTAVHTYMEKIVKNQLRHVCFRHDVNSTNITGQFFRKGDLQTASTHRILKLKLTDGKSVTCGPLL